MGGGGFTPPPEILVLLCQNPETAAGGSENMCYPRLSDFSRGREGGGGVRPGFQIFQEGFFSFLSSEFQLK